MPRALGGRCERGEIRLPVDQERESVGAFDPPAVTPRLEDRVPEIPRIGGPSSYIYERGSSQRGASDQTRNPLQERVPLVGGNENAASAAAKIASGARCA
jgi:hypothetical protein